MTRAKAPPERLIVRAEVVIDEVEDSGHRIVSSTITARARAEIDESAFRPPWPTLTPAVPCRR